MSDLMRITSSPHIHSGKSVKGVMWAVVLALVPSGLWGIWAFGFNALYLIAASVITCVITEAVILKLRGKPIAINDGSAFLTGLLLAYNVSPDLPIWAICIGAFFAIAVAKQAFGGLGRNIFNPALAGRAFLMASWPTYMVTFKNPKWQIDALTSATPLTNMKHDFGFPLPSYLDLLIGNRGGCIGEVCIAALLIGAAYLLYKKYIDLRVPISYIGTVALLSWAFMGNGLFRGDWVFYVLSGGLVLGAFYMATDYVTSPITKNGKLIFGVLCGVLTFAIRKWGGYPEGVCYSILIMNAAVPIIERHTRPARFGGK
ncbi:MAG: RnfABCDGE type electron transport complex subunit D [Dehalococcoidia bacterium]|nr:MAG: RnfABCDGE type electron transport complex subunit D [Dehalococcoidia bacterium]